MVWNYRDLRVRTKAWTMHPKTGFCQGMQESCPDPESCEEGAILRRCRNPVLTLVLWGGGNIQGMQKSCHDLESCEEGQYSEDAGIMPWPWILWKGGNIQGMQESWPDPESCEEGAILRRCRSHAQTPSHMRRGPYSGDAGIMPWPWVLWGGGNTQGLQELCPDLESSEKGSILRE